ncbi:hypothetical protein Leryth_026461 [Lithospermum erythrorhizon]|nr:hypothetical protein Leryth_026461 [Lithospermum erythrorhizon]
MDRWKGGVGRLSVTAPPWNKRRKVIRGVIEAIYYLHEGSARVRDLKTTSILICEDGEPVLSRFKVDTHKSSTRKIFKLGVFILEMVTNKRAHEDFERAEASFVEWVRINHPDNLEGVIDMRMKKTAHLIDQTTEAIALGLTCTNLPGAEQPSWEQIYI